MYLHRRNSFVHKRNREQYRFYLGTETPHGSIVNGKLKTKEISFVTLGLRETHGATININ